MWTRASSPAQPSVDPNSCGADIPVRRRCILNFTEWALGQNQQPLSWPGQQNVGLGIDPPFAYADYLAPDAPFSCKTQCPQPWSLADFFIPFGTNTERDFTLIKGTNYPTSDFLDPPAYFTNYPMDPDNDVTDDN
jgi:hypothetical protein